MKSLGDRAVIINEVTECFPLWFMKGRIVVLRQKFSPTATAPMTQNFWNFNDSFSNIFDERTSRFLHGHANVSRLLKIFRCMFHMNGRVHLDFIREFKPYHFFVDIFNSFEWSDSLNIEFPCWPYGERCISKTFPTNKYFISNLIIRWSVTSSVIRRLVGLCQIMCKFSTFNRFFERATEVCEGLHRVFFTTGK